MNYHVVITGPSREAVFDQAARLLRIAGKDSAPVSIAAVLCTPAPLSGRDNWSVIVNADIAFSPTSMPLELPFFEHGPALEVEA